MENWSELTEDIVIQVLELLTCVEDFVRFAAVCKPWRSIALRRATSFIPFSPWLMLAKRSNDNINIENGNDIRSFFSLSQKQFFKHQLPQAQGRRCWGSPYGWLVTIGLDLNIHILNPLSKFQISLPPQPTLQAQSKVRSYVPNMDKELAPSHIIKVFTEKFVLASNPSFWNSPIAQPSLVFAIFGLDNELAYSTPGNATWTCVADSENIDDVVFFNGKIYSVDALGALWVCEINTRHPRSIQIAEPRESMVSIDRFYLLEISKELHLVLRVFRSVNGSEENRYMVDRYKTHVFTVFKFDFDGKKWNQLNDLGDHALFLGDNTSFSISTSIYTELEGNSIYFSDDHPSAFNSGVYDMGVFDYRMGTVVPFPVHANADSQFSRPLFFLPSLL
ncbi:SWR1-complex protein 3 [Ranunculus cassubicifolius]